MSLLDNQNMEGLLLVGLRFYHPTLCKIKQKMNILRHLAIGQLIMKADKKNRRMLKTQRMVPKIWIKNQTNIKKKLTRSMRCWWTSKKRIILMTFLTTKTQLLGLIQRVEVSQASTSQSLISMPNAFRLALPLIKVLEDHCLHISFSVRKKEKNWRKLTLNGAPGRLWSRSVCYGRRCLKMKKRNSRLYQRKTDQGMSPRERNSLIRKMKKEVKNRIIKSLIL